MIFMLYTLLIPRERSRKENRGGGGSDFWDGYWKNFQDTSLYTRRINSVKSLVGGISNLPVSENVKLYADIEFAEEATSKSNRPAELLSMVNLDVVEAKDSYTYTVSGKKNDFKKLQDILNSSSFELAKSGEGIKKKEMNLYRQTFSIASINSRNTEIGKRLSPEMQNLINERYTNLLDCIIEVYVDGFADYAKHYRELVTKLGVSKIKERDAEVFVTNASYRASLLISEVQELLSDIKFNFISQIKLYPTLVAQRCIPGVNLNSVVIGRPETEETFGIFDSGIDSILLNSIVSHRSKHLPAGKPEDKSHGTFVASRVAFGEKIFTTVSSGSVTPIGKILDIQVMFNNSEGIPTADFDLLLKSVNEVLKRHSATVCVYNFSISYGIGVSNNVIDDLTEFIDKKCREYDVIFVCTAGNQTYYKSEGYDTLFSNLSLSTNIASPGDSLNAISVGSISRTVSTDTICKIVNYPSPFTRKGGFRNGWKKPELVADGGNVQIDPLGVYSDSFMTASHNNFGVEGVSISGLNKEIGTSHSTPLVTRQCLYLWNYIKKSSIPTSLNLSGNRSNLIKALLVHSTSKINQSNIEDENIKKAYGFGEPDYTAVIKDDDNSFTFIYTDIIEYAEKKQKINIVLPDRLVGNSLEFVVTLVYNPPVNKNFPQNYNQISLNCALRLIVPTEDENGETGSKVDYIKPTKWNWDSYKQENYNTIHFRSKKKRLATPHLEVLVQMDVFDEYEKLNIGHENDITQNYSLVLTVYDKTAAGTLRSEILSSGQFQEVLENVVDVQIEI